MNQGEASHAASILKSKGYHAVEVDQGVILDEAFACILFTCDVVQTTENRMYKRIRELEPTGKRIFIAGCLASIAGSQLQERSQGLVILDTMGLDRTRTSINEHFPTLPAPPVKDDVAVNRLHHIVPISTGCIGSCTYCITRLARGPIKSYPIESILNMVRKGVKKGKREILITSQDCASYGMDVRSSPALDELISRIVDEVVGTYRIRIGMMNPDTLIPYKEKLFEVFDHPSVFKFFHIPIQSGSDRILKAMGRKHRTDDHLGLFEAIRNRYPGSTISTDLIIGFPGEVPSDQERNKKAVLGISPDILNITRFSPRPGTDASSISGRVIQRTVKERSREIARSHSELLGEKLRGRIGDQIECMITERVRSGSVMARDGSYSPVVIQGDLALGDIVQVRIKSIGPTYLVGEVMTAER